MKKFLSVALALAMTLSLVVVGASAKDFTDNSKINYKEAVDVISGCKIVDGYTDGSFGAANTLTRGAAAKIICNMMLTPSVAATLVGSTTTFKDVTSKNVFAGYIAYCSEKGIINGYADNTFRPSNTVTGYQFMKMLLGALGYDSKIEKYVGDNWTVNVATKAAELGLYSGNAAFLGSKAMTREEACLYAFNTMKATVVKYNNKGTEITLNGVTIATGASEATPVDNKTADYREASASNTTQASGTMQFCEKYFPNLTLKESDPDSFKRPAHSWYYGADKAQNANTLVASYADKPILTYTTAVTGGKLYTDLGKVTPATGKLKVYLNGNTSTRLNADTVAANIKSGDTHSYGGNGTAIEVYKTGTDTYTIVAVSTFVGTIKSHTAAVKDANGDITTKEKVTVTIGTQDYSFDTTAFTATDATNKTVVIATATTSNTNPSVVADYTVQSLKAAKSATVTASSCIVDKSVDKSFVADGKTYTYNENTDGKIAAANVTNKDSKVVYFDDYGYVIKVADPSSTATLNYAVVTDISTGTIDSWSGKTTYQAKIVGADGKEMTVSTGTVNPKVKLTVGDVCSYEVSSGVYTLAKETNTDNLTNAQSLTLKQGVSAITWNGTLYGNAKTLYFVRTGAGTTASPYTYTVYTGFAAVPSYTGSVKGAAVVKNGIADVVYIQSPTATATSTDTIFVNMLGAQTVVTADGSYMSVNAIVNGTPKVLTVATDTHTGVYTTMTTTNGVVTLSDAGAKAITKIEAAANGVLKINDTYMGYTADCAVYTYGTDGTITASSVGAIATATSATGFYTANTNGVVTAIYLLG